MLLLKAVRSGANENNQKDSEWIWLLTFKDSGRGERWGEG